MSSASNESRQCDNDNCNDSSRPHLQQGNKNGRGGDGGTGQDSFLFAFDFDHTVVNDNSDTYITKLANTPIPKEVKSFYDGTNWTEYMNKVFIYLHQQGVTILDISKCVQQMEPTKGMIPLLKSLVQLKTGSITSSDLNGGSSTSSPKVNLLVISDANDMFISDYLKAQVLSMSMSNSEANCNSGATTNLTPATFQYSTTTTKFPIDIITNKVSQPEVSPPLTPNSSNNNLAKNKSASALNISPYEVQTSCKICPKNLCKGSAILKYIEEHGPFTRVFYTGDGGNDICPALKLNQHDLVFVRKDYGMYKKLQKSENCLGITAKLLIWEDAELIRSTINEYIQHKL